MFGVGQNRLKINSEQVDKLDDAITRGSMRSLKKDDIVTIPKKQGISRGRQRQKRKNKAWTNTRF
uniref:Ribosomal protein L19E n=1 Tax=uncultured marine thaumarchaeote AD1000_33_G09 TaxID=1455909 RepID=A0A075FPU9_9ARCH|nr:Ribosomal protein L19E [uncultured marine thaumarchaeote AD1000_33_G09]